MAIFEMNTPQYRESKDEGYWEFSVFQFFPDGSYEQVLRSVDAKTAVEKAKVLTETVGAKIGTTKRIIITDGGDFTCFEWKFGEGVTYPSPEMRRG